MSSTLNVLDLFSGIGGFSLGLHRAGMTTVAFCEREPYPQAVLRKNFPGVPIYDDVRTLTAERLRADGIHRVDVVAGGYPCQPFSLAGKRGGQDDDRHLWPAMRRIVQETGPAWVLCENVVGHISLGLESVCLDLEAAGYGVQPFVIPAGGVGARHLRYRVWIVAHSKRNSLQGGAVVSKEGEDGLSGLEEQLARFYEPCTWPSLSVARDYRNDDGLPSRVHRNKALGNAVIPQIPEIIGRAIMQVEFGGEYH